MNKILIYVAHIDDELLTCGGTLARFSRDDSCDIRVVYANNGLIYWGRFPGKDIRHKAEAGLSALSGKGIKFHFLNIPTMEFERYGQLELNRRLDDILRHWNWVPDTIITHHPNDVNKDHKIVNESSRVFSRCYAETKKLLYMEYVGNSMLCNFYIPFDRPCYKAKLRALEAVSCEMKAAPHPRSYEVIEAQTKLRGAECGHFYAEGYEVGKWVL